MNTFAIGTSASVDAVEAATLSRSTGAALVPPVDVVGVEGLDVLGLVDGIWTNPSVGAGVETAPATASIAPVTAPITAPAAPLTAPISVPTTPGSGAGAGFTAAGILDTTGTRAGRPPLGLLEAITTPAVLGLAETTLAVELALASNARARPETTGAPAVFVAAVGEAFAAELVWANAACAGMTATSIAPPKVRPLLINI